MASPARSKVKSRRPSRLEKAPELNGNGRGKTVVLRRTRVETPAPTPAALVHELGSCVTEADIVQVLYRGLHPLFGYDVVNLHVLEREGWYHSLPMDSGVLQDVRRRPLSGSVFARQYANPRTAVIPLDPQKQEISKGPGVGRSPKFAIWVPIEHQGEVIGSVIYQWFRRRRVPATETAFLDEVHRRLGVLLANAYLNELTRNQARRLDALNGIARAMASTLDEASVLTALHGTLSQLLPVDVLHMVALDPEQPDRVRLMNVEADSVPTSREVAMKSAHAAPVRTIVRDPKPLLTHEPGSALWVPIKEGGLVRGALGIKTKRSYAYEASTAVFLELVSDEVTLALRNARSYEAIEGQRRRLEVVNSIGRRLASSLDRWSIMRTLREELSTFLDFDGFILATITHSEEGPVAEGYQYVAGVEEVVPPVALAVTGPSREAFETRQPVLVRSSPWARSFARKGVERERWNVGGGAAVFPSGPPGDPRLISRSFVWVPVLSGERITAMLSLQSYREGAFDEWHVKLLQDVAAHVSLALANADHFAEAQAERARLEALHGLDMRVAGASDESQIADAVFSAVSDFTDATHVVLAYLDVGGNVVGFTGERGGETGVLGPVPISEAPFFKRLMEAGGEVMDSIEPVDDDMTGPVGHYIFSRKPSEVVWVPIMQNERVVAGISALRDDGGRFLPAHLKLLEAAASVVGIALRTMRLHHANELALAQSVRIQELAALAGHELMSVVSNIADQARTMLESAGVACWAFDIEGHISATRGSGDAAAESVLAWAGLNTEDTWRDAPTGVLSGEVEGRAWSLIPLWYGDRLVGAIGSVHAATHMAEPPPALEFARHAAVAIENSRLVAETRGRIITLEAVAKFTELTPTEPDRARSEMGRLVSTTLAGSQGELWLLEDGHLVRRSNEGDVSPRVPVDEPAQLLRALMAPTGARRMRALLDLLGASNDAFGLPIQVEGRLVGLLVARMTAGASETRRLAGVLAGQAAVLIGQLELVDALERERQMMNAILRHSPVGVMLEDADGRIVYANPEVEAIYRLQAADMPGKKLSDIYAAAGALRGDDDQADGTLELQMGDPVRIVHVRRVVIPGLEGEPAGILTLHEDVTAQRLALEAKDLMLRAIGHEVRSPAAAMKNTLAGIMQWDSTIDPSGRRELLQEAYESSDRLLSLVESQLIIAKLETRHFEPAPEPVDVASTLEGVMGVIHHRYAERSLAVEINLRDGLPPAMCEPAHLAQVLTNLIGNALEYTQGAVSVEARAASRGWLEVTVADHGPGLPSGSLEGLFEKTGPAGRNRSQGGLGLGLYLCRLVVERSFGGRIWVASSDRGGTTFKFTVPAIAVSQGKTRLGESVSTTR
ncbi:MAG TPA: GAF domain-containing protein [Candidatus Dormibacteraeota bacterium]|nr:GAF domain-containing protein [Candidatus Dormibacteraeota bacterium]